VPEELALACRVLAIKWHSLNVAKRSGISFSGTLCLNIPDGRPGRKPVATRRILEAVLWILNTGAPGRLARRLT